MSYLSDSILKGIPSLSSARRYSERRLQIAITDLERRILIWHKKIGVQNIPIEVHNRLESFDSIFEKKYTIKVEDPVVEGVVKKNLSTVKIFQEESEKSLARGMKLEYVKGDGLVLK